VRRLLPLVSLLIAAPLAAQAPAVGDAPAQAPAPEAKPAPEPEPAAEPAAGVEAEDAVAAAKRSAKQRKKKKQLCGCASPRLLRKGKEISLDGTRSLSAWVRTDGSAHVEYFQRDAESGEMTGVVVPVVQQVFDVGAFGDPVPSTASLVRVFPTEPFPEPFWIGVLKPPSRLPADVVLVEATAPPQSPPPGEGTAPETDELWVGPLQVREKAGCGELRTHRVQWKAPEDATTDPAGFLVEYTPTGGASTVSLVDVRHARIFGLGRVETCEQGVPFQADTDGEIVVRPVSAAFAVGDGWRWRVGLGTGEMPTPLGAPGGRDLDADDNPFLEPAIDPVEGLLSDEKDHVAFGAMAFVVLGAAALARVFWAGRRRRGRHIETLACPVCEEELTLDLDDPESDGAFCPKCGKSSVFVRFEADGTPLASVFALDEEQAAALGRSDEPDDGDEPST
jgi:hypothetical protein